MEIEQIDKGSGMVTPLYHKEEDRKSPQSGMHCENGLGYDRPREKLNEQNELVDNTDVGYLKQFANVKELAPEMYAFAQARNGVGKFFSLRSTEKDITSNHGVSFSSDGEIKLDLAQVSSDDFVFHYAGGGADSLKSGLEGKIKNKKWSTNKHSDELTRAKESLLRNREIILKQYPAKAVVKWTKEPKFSWNKVKNKGYSDGFWDKRADFISGGVKDAYAEGKDYAGYKRGRDDGYYGRKLDFGVF